MSESANARADIDAELLYDWATMHARENQIEPQGNWNTWLLLAGRGFGKTRTSAEWIRSRVERGKAKRIALLGRTSGEVRDVMIEGESGLLAVSPPWFKPIYEPSKRRLTWPNGAIATTFTADEPDMLRGPQFDCFVAGTMIATPTGERAIESIKVGDWVCTRSGPRRVVDARDRVADVGGVDFSDSFLIGTEEHPVLTEHGWTRLKDLTTASILFAGTQACAATSSRTRTGSSIASIAGYGSVLSALFRVASTSTTRTATQLITDLQIWLRCLPEIIEGCTPKRINELVLAFDAARSFGDSSNTPLELFVSAVSTRAPMRSEARTFESVLSVGGVLQRATRGSAPSVARTWRAAGRKRVYNITVEGAHEYFANGVLVHNCAWVDELASFRFTEAWDNLRFGLRLGKRPRVIVSTTPRPVQTIRDLIADPSTHVTRGSSYENKKNLAEDFFKRILAKYEGTRLGQQEIHAEVLDDTAGALWTQKLIDENRKRAHPQLVRIVVSIDPSVSSNEESDECGIVIAGLGTDGHGYVLDDVSGILSPDAWARKAVKIYKDRKADRIVAEVNNGGDLVEFTLRAVDRNVSYKKVHASRGKQTRAEPVSALYEQGRVHHVGAFSKLESQMCTWVPGISKKSPDRMDALVWAITDLMLGPGHTYGAIKLGDSSVREAPNRIE